MNCFVRWMGSFIIIIVVKYSMGWSNMGFKTIVIIQQLIIVEAACCKMDLCRMIYTSDLLVFHFDSFIITKASLGVAIAYTFNYRIINLTMHSLK
jgi:hypothetical protein